ncbi:calcium-binding EGF domain-containing protein [Ditylenchus destructor]|uniref:Calcium-binding EGF domain-containing protein n=1 Tax=Ditylenchus destructor TaxID=166010 RepID=A0AAD4NDM2_9BILA|nr:calcium-binding EGF domain-containing protein [Ditylenchus destructor]
MFRMRFATLLSLLLAISSMTVCNTDEADDKSLSLFDDSYIARMENEIIGFSAQQKQEVLSKLGKIALYMRLYRSWIRSPITGHHGFEKYFPEPHVRFNAEIYDSCSTCIKELFSNIQKRATLLFPRKGQHIESFTLDEDIFRRTVTNGMFSYDVSVSYLMCFFTKKKLSLFARIPFCAYGVDKNQSKIWPSAAFKDYKSRDEFSSNDEGPEPLDDLLNQDAFQCADESFCPDPCCGRITGRSSSDNFKEAFCANSACLSNVNQTKSIAAKHDKNMDSKEKPTHSCYVDEIFNDDLIGIMENRWNLSCSCVTDNGTKDTSRIYRFDVGQCVDLNECFRVKCKDDEKCINTVGGYQCVCKFGYLREATNGQCVPIEFKYEDLYYGPFEQE